MPPLTINRIESDNNDGWFIEWHDAANLDGQSVTGFFHLTEQSITELIVHQRRPNKAPETKLMTVLDRLGENASAGLVSAFRVAYQEIIQDRIDRHNFGMKAVTSHGHADLVAVRGGAAVNKHNKVKSNPKAFEDFMRGG